MEGLKEAIFKLLRIDSLVDSVSGYVENRVKLLKLEIREDVANVLSKGLVHTFIFLFAFFFIIFFSLGLAQFLNNYFDGGFEGYWIVSGAYFLVFLLLLVIRKPLDKKFRKYFTAIITKED